MRKTGITAFLIPTIDGNILNFNGEGKKIKGWDFEPSAYGISAPIQYFAMDGKDYIVSVDDGGVVRVLNRRGEDRITLKEQLPVRKNMSFFLELHKGINNCKIVTTDSIGNVVKLRLNDQKENIHLGSFGKRFYFEYHDLNNDKNMEYLFLHGQQLSVFDQNKNALFQINFSEGMPERFNYFSALGKYGKIGVVDQAAGQIYLYYDAGGLGADFPLHGNTEFAIDDINKDGANEVVVGHDKSVVTYRLRR